MNLLSLGLGSVGVCCFLVACGGKSDLDNSGDTDGASASSGKTEGIGDTADDSSTGESGADSATSESDSGVDGSGGSMTSSGSGGGANGSGATALLNADLLIDLLYLKVGSAAPRAYLNAAFRDGKLYNEDDSCVHEVIADCDFRTCSGVPEAPEQSLEAGLVRVDFNVEGDTISGSISPDTSGAYEGMWLAADVPYLYGEDANFSAEGGEIEGFSQTLEVPWPLKNLQVGERDGSTYSLNVSPDEALTISWQPGDAGTYFLAQSPVDDAISGVERKDVTCAFPAEAGTGTIDATIMSQLPPGTVILTYAARLHDLYQGDKHVRLRTVADTADADGLFPLQYVVQ